MELPAELRHVYRALLRAATYLPDSVARVYIHNHIVQRFRAVADKAALQTNEGVLPDNLLARYHGSKHIASLRREANKLERAGLGGGTELKSVIMHTYGRVGRRRRELLKELLQPEDGILTQDPAFLAKLKASSPADIPIRYPPHSKFGTLLKYQSQHTPGNAKEHAIRSIKPKIDKENMWGRPMPLKRVANAKKRWWAETLDRILPPIPMHEWNHLRDLATGAIPIEEVPKRRSRPASSVRLEGEENDKRLLSYFTVPIQLQKGDLDKVTIADDGVSFWSKTGPLVKVSHHSQYTHTARYMRRFYANIWLLTPTMWKNPDSQTWNIKYGADVSAFYSGRITAASPMDEELFDGAKDARVVKLVKASGRIAKKELASGLKLKLKIGPTEAGYTQGLMPNLFRTHSADKRAVGENRVVDAEEAPT
jgi:hypothetical protein